MVVPAQGDIWWAESEDGRRPVLVVTRSSAIPVLQTLIVAPVTRTVRRIPTEIGLDKEHGLSVSCAASFDSLLRVRQSHLTERVGALGPAGTAEICRALGALADC